MKIGFGRKAMRSFLPPPPRAREDTPPILVATSWVLVIVDTAGEVLQALIRSIGIAKIS
jgi:hypothetical protein